MEKLDPAKRKVTPRPFLILAAWEPPKPIHFWKGHQKSGRNGVVKISPTHWDLMTLMEAGRGGNAFWGSQGLVQKMHFRPFKPHPGSSNS